MSILKTDLYQIAMLGAHYKKGSYNKVITCEAFARKMPPTRCFFVMAGTEEIQNFLLNMKFSKDDINYLKEVPQLKNLFLNSNFETYLEDFKFTGDMFSMAEGEIVFANEPLIRVTAPLPQAHLAETYILSVLNHDVRITSKAARIILAARGKPVLEFATRRTHPDAAINVSRCAYLAGFSATSNVEAGRRFRIPISGTMAHMWVMAHESEKKAFENFKDVYNSPILLIDTYDSIKGTETATTIKSLQAVRLDSGDLVSDSEKIRNILDKTNNKFVKIIVSGDLDEYKINLMNIMKAPIDVFAVGTELVAQSDNSSLGIVYKAVYDDSNKRPLIKKSLGKINLAGKKQVFIDTRSKWNHLVTLENTVDEQTNLVPILDQYLKNGKRLPSIRSLEASRLYCNTGLKNLSGNLANLHLSGSLNVPVKFHDSLLTYNKEFKNE